MGGHNLLVNRLSDRVIFPVGQICHAASGAWPAGSASRLSSIRSGTSVWQATLRASEPKAIFGLSSFRTISAPAARLVPAHIGKRTFLPDGPFAGEGLGVADHWAVGPAGRAGITKVTSPNHSDPSRATPLLA